MSCSSCMQSNPCGCKKKKSCDDCPVVDWVPNTACTIGVTMNGCTDTLELRPGIQNCETKTHMTQNQKTGCIEYQNELYVATDGQEGYIESICPVDIAKFINLEDLANVEDEQPEQCSLLIYHADNDCGPGCTGVTDSWVHWYASEHLTTGLHWVAGFNEDGCLEALDVPPRVDEYWWGMYRPSDTGTGVEFGYIQPEPVDELPTDEDGNILVISEEPNGKPVIGKLKADFCSGAVQFTNRNADPEGNAFFTPNSTTYQEFNVTPDNNPAWRAPTCGLMIVNYCVNPKNQYATGTGYAEIDVTCMLSDQQWDGTATAGGALEALNSTHSTWMFDIGRETDVSESCTAAMIVQAGQTIKLHARNTGDSHVGMSAWSGKWRVHAVKAVFIPLALQ